MKFIESLEAGRPLRRKGNDRWFRPPRYILIFPIKDGEPFKVPIEELFSADDDWEIEEPSVTISESKYGQSFNEAVRETMMKWNYSDILDETRETLRDHLNKTKPKRQGAVAGGVNAHPR